MPRPRGPSDHVRGNRVGFVVDVRAELGVLQHGDGGVRERREGCFGDDVHDLDELLGVKSLMLGPINTPPPPFLQAFLDHGSHLS
jgi:hypothetical protein